ncbi:hypothetical protein KEM56_007674 [Ascosphaera pollenicola]|nr:hypothetical protein KEM56_007674 [Ascosphaera pollenicola]
MSIWHAQNVYKATWVSFLWAAADRPGSSVQKLKKFLDIKMFFNSAAVLLTAAACVAAGPLLDSSPGRPDVTFSPKQPFKPLPKSHSRTKVCNVEASGDGKDDSDNILDALHRCNDGGHVVFGKDKDYTIGKALDMTFLKHVDIGAFVLQSNLWEYESNHQLHIDIRGKITFTDDMDYWQKNSFKYTFQNESTFFKIGGEDVNIYGGGELYGNGPIWWKVFAKNKNLWRPILFCIDGLKGGLISDLRLTDSPNWVNVILNSQDVVYNNITIENKSQDPKVPAKNTDGCRRDTYRSDNIVIQNSKINNGDARYTKADKSTDCVSFKPNSTNILVQNLWCNGSHGISVGSLGQYVGKTDIVENVTVYNIDMNHASDGARIKAFPGAIGSATDQGGGTGHVKNVTYENIHNNGNEWGIEITQCYALKGHNTQDTCNKHPSSLIFEDILFKNFTGTTSSKHQPNVATLICSNPKVCSNIRVEDFNVKSPNGSTDAICTNMDNKLLGLNCTSG